MFGTRPEAIKMAPLVNEFKKHPKCIDARVSVTAQHREMLDQVLNVFNIQPDYDLNLMRSGQNLSDLTSSILLGMGRVLDDFNPDIVLVHGDTTTAFSVSISAFYHVNNNGKKVKIGHIEAGLRTDNIYNPWPEEMNRRVISVIANYHFTPTTNSAKNLIKENKDEGSILITGNTVVDSLFLTLDNIKSDKNLKNKIKIKLNDQNFTIQKNRKFILVTGHRRENFGIKIVNICKALEEIALKNPGIDIIYPVHPNPKVQEPVNKILSNKPNIFLIKPLCYESFVYLMHKSYFIITDSGGVQEEAPSLGKPVLVTRDTTERPEAVESGTVKLVGTNTSKIALEAQRLLNDNCEYLKMSRTNNPYGDGNSCKKIVDFVKART